MHHSLPELQKLISLERNVNIRLQDGLTVYSYCLYLQQDIDATSKTNPKIWIFLQITLPYP